MMKATAFTSTASILEMARQHVYKANYAMPKGWLVYDEAQELQAAATEPPNYSLCGPYIYANGYTVVGGDDKAGKTKFIEAWAWRALEGKEFIPGMPCEVDPKDLWIACLDFELSPSANAKRNGSRLEKWRGTGRYKKIRPDFKNQDPTADPVDALLEVIEHTALSLNRNVIIVDNILAAIGDVSDNQTFLKLRHGLMRIIQERKEAGHWLTIILLIHLTKGAQDRRQEHDASISRKSDLRGAGAMQSMAESVMEVRRSSLVEGLTLVLLFGTRHTFAEVSFDRGTAHAFKTDHTVGKWDMHYDHVAQIVDHFGKSRPQAPHEVSEASKLGRDIENQIVSLYGMGKSDNAIHKELKQRAGTGNPSPSRDSIATFLRATGRPSHGRKFGSK